MSIGEFRDRLRAGGPPPDLGRAVLPVADGVRLATAPGLYRRRPGFYPDELSQRRRGPGRNDRPMRAPLHHRAADWGPRLPNPDRGPELDKDVGSGLLAPLAAGRGWRRDALHLSHAVARFPGGRLSRRGLRPEGPGVPEVLRSPPVYRPAVAHRAHRRPAGGPGAARLGGRSGLDPVADPRVLPGLHPGLARGVRRRQARVRPDARRLVQRPQRLLPRPPAGRSWSRTRG